MLATGFIIFNGLCLFNLLPHTVICGN